MQALSRQDIEALGTMYRNLFRDPCATGLVGRPWGLEGPPKGLQRIVYLGDVLFRLDYWKSQTDGRFGMRDLAGPGVGNPFGLILDGILVESGAEYRHYCANRVNHLLEPGRATVVEIGGGFGGMAYYLLRDRPNVRYLDFDLPESIALTSWYIGKAFPHLRLQLFGEEVVTPEVTGQADVALMPLFELARMPPQSADVTFSSHALSDIAPADAASYFRDIARVTRRSFLYIGTDRTARLLADSARQSHTPLQPGEIIPSGWHDHLTPSAGFVECLFRVADSPGARD
jgi:hypothetical protein